MKQKMTLQQLRKKKGYTLKEVAARTGIPFSSLTAYELGYRTASLNAAIQLAEFYGVEVNDIEFLGAKIKKEEE